MGLSNLSWDEYNAESKKQKDENYQKSMAVFEKAQELAKVNGLELIRHSTWHFALIYKADGSTKWLWNLYPSNQRIYTDPRFKGPFLKVAKPWTFLEVVAAAIIQVQCPKDILKQLRSLV